MTENMNSVVLDLNARLAEVEVQRNFALTRAAEFAGRLATLQVRVDGLTAALAERDKQIAELTVRLEALSRG